MAPTGRSRASSDAWRERGGAHVTSRRVAETDEHQHHEHEHADAHDHAHGGRIITRLREYIAPHSHDASDRIDDVLETSRRGIRALWVSLLGLVATAALQVVVVVASGSVALLGDTLHNVADALTAVPLWLAFTS